MLSEPIDNRYKYVFKSIEMLNHDTVGVRVHMNVHYMAKSIPLLMNRFDYFSHFHEYNDIRELCASNFISTVWTEPFSILTWQCLCV